MAHTSPNEHLNTDRFCSMSEVQHHAGGASKSTIYRWIDKKKFPAPYRLGDNRVGWSFLEIQAWIADRKAAA